MSSSLLLQQCPVCLARLTWMVFKMKVAVQWGAANRICLKQFVTFLCSSHLPLSLFILSASM